jgi:hypothetical protein
LTEEQNISKEENKKNIFLPPSPRIVNSKIQNNRIENKKTSGITPKIRLVLRKAKSVLVPSPYHNWQISKLDIEICSIRQVPLPSIVNNIYKPNRKKDTWACRNCKTRGDKWFLMIHLCKGPNRSV